MSRYSRDRVDHEAISDSFLIKCINDKSTIFTFKNTRIVVFHVFSHLYLEYMTACTIQIPKKGLLYSCRATTGREGKYVSRHMCIIQSQSSIIDHLNSNGTNETAENIENFADIKINKSSNLYGKFYLDEARKMASWEEVYNNLDVTPLKDYDYLYLMAGIDLHSSGMTRTGNRVGVFPRDKGQLKFVSHGKIFTNVLAMLKANREYSIPLHEYQYDTGEISLNLFHQDYVPISELYASYYNHDLPSYGIQRMDSLQYYFQNKRQTSYSLFTTQKDVDFCFAYTVLKTSGRKDFPVFIDELAKEFSNTKIFTKNYFTGVDTSIDSDTYSEFVERSRFTMILPAYDRNSYAIDRLITALNSGCLPLLHSECNNEVVEKSYNVDLSPLVIKLPSDVRRFPEHVRLELLEYYQDKILRVERGLVNFGR